MNHPRATLPLQMDILVRKAKVRAKPTKLSDERGTITDGEAGGMAYDEWSERSSRCDRDSYAALFLDCEVRVQ